jgi:surface antigen
VTEPVESAGDRGSTRDDHTVVPQPASRRERRALERGDVRSTAAPVIPAAVNPVPAIPVPHIPVAAVPAATARPVLPVAAAAPAGPRVSRPAALRSKVSAIGTMAAVVAIFGVFAIPAYALDTTGVVTAESDAAGAALAQTVAVDDEVLLTTASRDAYGATSYAEYLEAQAALLRSSYGLSVAVAGDDYPFRGGSGLSALGYYMGQCTDFVAWRLNRDVGSVGAPWAYTWSRMTPNGGDAEQWLSSWQANGWPVSTTPVAGAVAWFGGNHVGYVKEVYADGSFMIEDYNRVAYETYAREIFQPGSIPYFLYPPG